MATQPVPDDGNALSMLRASATNDPQMVPAPLQRQPVGPLFRVLPMLESPPRYFIPSPLECPSSKNNSQTNGHLLKWTEVRRTSQKFDERKPDISDISLD